MSRSDRRTFLTNTMRAGAAVATAGAVAGPPGAASGAPAPPGSTGPGAPGGLTVNGLGRGVGVDPDDLFFAFTLADLRRGARQGSYRITVAADGVASRRAVWDSGPVDSARQAFIAYTGPALTSDTAYRWTVASADAGGRWSPASAPGRFATGLRPADWVASWLRPGPVATVPEEYTYVRTDVRPSGSPIVRATAYVAAAHRYQLWLNGVLVDSGPSFSFPDESYYQATDVTAVVRAGRPNGLGALHHWYSSGSGRPLSAPGLLLQLNVHHADGTREVFGTDRSWRTLGAEWQPAPQRNNESGEFVEIIDGRAAPVGWSEPGFDTDGWTPPTVLGPVGTPPFTALYAQRTRISEHPVPPVSLRTLPDGSVVADFGKVLAARPLVHFGSGVDGRTVPMHVGYLLDPDGHVSTTHGTQYTDLSFSYTQRAGAQVFDPYTYLGFRYLEIDGPGETITPAQVSARARHATMPELAPATFSTSDPALDAVWGLCTHSALYASHEQFVDTPTRQKGQFSCDGANESMAIMRAYGDQNLSWQALRDFERSQARFWPDGRISDVYPDGNGPQDIPDFTELFPEWVWRYYAETGDLTTLTRLGPVIANICDYIWRAIDPVTGLVTDLPGGGSDYQGGLVDWPPQMRYGYDMGTAARTTVNILAVNAFNRAHTIAAALGDETGAATQAGRSAALSAAVNARLFNAQGVYIDGLAADGTPSTHAGQQGGALALAYGVVPAERMGTVAAHVASLGIAMGPDHGMELLRGLHRAGLDAHLVHVLTDPHGPGWAHILASGGTFCWEDWVPSDLDGDSMSHGWGSSALVAIHEALLGLTIVSPGGDSAGPVFEVAPPGAAGLSGATGSAPTTAGPLAVRWRRAAGRLALDVALPPNASARVVLPPGAGAVTEGGVPAEEASGVRALGPATGSAPAYLVGAGAYSFAAHLA